MGTVTPTKLNLPELGQLHTYSGAWINWSHGAIRGATITIPRAYGGFLVAFLAVYVTFAGGLFWRFLSFILHQKNTTASGKKRDGLHHQRQVIFRNDGAIVAFWELAKMPANWHGKAEKPFLRVLAYALLALLTVALFSVASIFTGEVTKAPGNSTIILGPYCGAYKAVKSQFSDDLTFLSTFLADTYDAAAYVRQCYGDNVSGLGCGLYSRRRLDFAVNANATCPFANGACLINNQSAFSMDTGFINSQFDLGINARPEHRIKYRRVTTCAPLRGGRWSRIENTTTFGEVLYIDAGPWDKLSYTFDYIRRSLNDAFGYSLSAVYSLTGQDSPWTPIPDLDVTDADITLIMLNQNSINYEVPSDDPWIPAHFPVNTSSGVLYRGDYNANLLGCTDQYQICNPNKGNSACTKLSGQRPVLHELGLPGNTVDLNEHQTWAAVRILESAIRMSMYYAVQGRGAGALNANEHTYSLSQYPIPATQWHTEVKIWFSVCLAKLQSYMVEWATEPRYVQGATEFLTHVPDDPIGKSMCRNQLVRDSGSHQSFSVLGMALILAIGGVLIVLGTFTDKLICWLGYGPGYRRAQWNLEEKLELQKAAYEARGMGISGEDDENKDLPPSSEAFVGYSREMVNRDEK